MPKQDDEIADKIEKVLSREVIDVYKMIVKTVDWARNRKYF
jgi:hypothetical protein